MNQAAAPYFSLVIPTYNRAPFISTLLESVLSQDFSDFEVIVVDDGSKDNTEEVVAGFTDPRIHYKKIPNSERGAARNFGASLSTGRYVNFVDSDDILLPVHLSTAHRLVIQKNDPEVFHLGYIIRHIQSGKDVPSPLRQNDNINLMLFTRGNVLSCNGVFVRRDIFMQNRFNEDRALAGSEDYELWMRLAARFRWYHDVTPTSVIINHDERSVLTIKKDQLVKRQQLLVENAFSDVEVKRNYSRYRKKVLAGSLSYIALHLVLANIRRGVPGYLLRTVLTYPLALLSKRVLITILKYLRIS